MQTVSENYSERAKKRKAEWGVEAFDNCGNLISGNGKSTDLLQPPNSNDEAFRNLIAAEQISFQLYSVSPELRLDKTKIEIKFRMPKALGD